MLATELREHVRIVRKEPALTGNYVVEDREQLLNKLEHSIKNNNKFYTIEQVRAELAQMGTK